MGPAVGEAVDVHVGVSTTMTVGADPQPKAKSRVISNRRTVDL